MKQSLIDIQLLRDHVKTDEKIDDRLLISYAESAFRHAENFTGIALTRRTQTELVNVRKGCGTLAYEPTGSISAYIYTDRVPHNAYSILGKNLVFVKDFLCEYGDCFEMMIEYTIGPKCSDDIHPSIIQGVLLYVAHAFENRGDMEDREHANSWLEYSGALAEWKPLRTISI